MFAHTSLNRIAGRGVGCVFAAIIACFVALAAAVADDDRDSVLEDILDRNKLRVGLSSFTPWAMRAKNGDFIGFEVDVANAVAEDLGVELEIVPTAWDGIIPALLGKKFDVIISGMYITPERNLQVNFTQAYDHNGLDLVANKSLAANLKTIEDFNNSDVVFALRRGTFPVRYVQNNLPKAQIRQFDDDPSARQEVLNGNAHAWITAEPQPAFAALDYPDKLFQPIDERLTLNRQGMALRKGDVDTLNFLNNWIAGRLNDGWLQERHAYWFGTRDWKEQLGDSNDS